MDSLCIAWWKRPDIALTIDYGQLSATAEVAASTAICQYLGIENYVIDVDCRSLGSGDMAGIEANSYAPATDWWPYRNQVLITLAAMRAIGLGANKLLIGTVKSDSSHKDGTQEFVTAISDLLAMQEGSLTVEAPAINLTTVELARLSQAPPGLLAWAHSCHKSDVACGDCRGCNKYFAVFQELAHGILD